MFNKLNTNITVEKIDTTESTIKQSSNKSKSTKESSKLSKESSKLSKKSSKSIKESTKRSESIKETKNTQNTKLTNIIENDIIKDIETLEDIPLVLSNISENDKDSYICTDTLFKSKKTKIKKSKSTKYTLIFPKTIEVDNTKYNIINKYIKKNYNSIVNLLYDKNLLKNKNSPYRIIFHIYVNYLHEDLNIIFE